MLSLFKYVMIEKGIRQIEKQITADMWQGMSEKMIWDEFKRGNNQALIHIYSAYFSILFNYALQFCNDRELVKDMIQDLFVYLYKTRKSINSTTSIKFYLFKCLRRRIADEIKRAKVVQSSYFPLSWEVSAEAMFIHTEDEQSKKKLIRKAIDKLSAKQQEIIYYIYYQNFSTQEVAAIMGFSQTKSARKLLYRALEALKKDIGPIYLYFYFLVVELAISQY